MKPETWSLARVQVDPAAILFLLLLPALFLVPITHDAIWQIWIGRQIAAGAKLYVDIIEVNPPLWFWIAAPLAILGDGAGAEAREIVIGFFAASIALSLFLSPRRYRIPLLFALTLLPLKDFGQREHFTFIAVAPYVFLIASRVSGQPMRFPWLIGIFAALGLALKPFFVLIPIVLELLVWRKPRIRPETLALGLSAAAYITAVLFLTPTYLTEVVPLVRGAYGSFTSDHSSNAPWIAFALAAAGSMLGRRKGSPLSRAMIIASIAFIPAVLIQAKGWPYHTIPVRGFLFLGIAVELMNGRRNVLADGFLFAATLICLLPFGVYKNPFKAEMEFHLQEFGPGTSINAVTPNPMAGWPIVEERKLKWASRQFCLWQLAGIFDNTRRASDYRDMVARDLARKPDILVIDRRMVVRRVVYSLIPEGYLAEYKLNKRSRLFDSYVRVTAADNSRTRK